MFDGYLNYGGNEVANNARTKGYADTAECPMWWFKGEVCPGVWEALAETDLYSYANITGAPWYDSANPESARFFGVFIVDVHGEYDSTRKASVTEGVGEGGVLGPTRKGVRALRVKAVVAAQGLDALEYGMAWLSRVLDPGTCGQHGSACGTVDLAFFAECPPVLADFQGGVWIPNPPTEDWTVIDTNVVTNPSFETATAPKVLATNLHTNPSFETPGASTVLLTNMLTNPSLESVAGMMPFELRRNIVINHPRLVNSIGDWITYGGLPLTAGPTGMVVDIPAALAVNAKLMRLEQAEVNTPGSLYSMSLDVEVPAGYPTVVIDLGAEEEGTVGYRGTPVTIYAGQKVRLSYSVTTISTANFRIPIHASGPLAAGSRFILSNVMWEKTLVGGPFFDGGTINAGDYTYLWVGTPEASASTQMVTPPVSIAPGRGAVGFSTSGWSSDRAKSIVLRQVEPNQTDSNVSLGGGVGSGMNFGVQAGKTYTIRARVRLIAPQAANGTGRARGITVFLNGGATELSTPSTPNVAGEYDVSLTFAVPAGTTDVAFRLYSGSGTVGEEIWFDDLMLVEGAYSGPYFDGATTAATVLRRNRFVNPSLRGTPNDIWGPMGDAVLTPTADGLQADWTDGNFALYGSFLTNNSYDFVTGSAEFYVPPGFPALTVTIVDEIRDGDGNNVASATSGPVVIQPGEAKRVGHSAMMPLTNPKTTKQRWVVSGTGTGANRVVMRDLLYETGVAGPYFDGDRGAPSGYDSAWLGAANASESTLSFDSGYTFAWTGAPDASTSTKSGLGVAGVPVPNGAEASQVGDSPVAGTKVLRFTLAVTSGVALGLIGESNLVNGGTYTMVGKVRPRSRAQTFTPQFRGAMGTPFTAQPNVWTEFRHTGVSGGAGEASSVGLVIAAGSGHQVGDLIDVDAVLVGEGYIPAFFDGDTPDGTGEAGFDYAWTGAPHASTSTVSAVDAADVNPPAGGTLAVKRWLSTDAPFDGARVMRHRLATPTIQGLPLTGMALTAGQPYTLVGKVRPQARDQAFIPTLGGISGPTFTAPVGEWTEFRFTATPSNPSLANTGLTVPAASGHQPGDLIDVDTVLVVAGTYLGPYFDGDTPDTENHRYAWTGTVDASTSTYETVVVTPVDPTWDPDYEDPEASWADAVTDLQRFMHDTGAVSGPFVTDEHQVADFWANEVEFVFVSERPYVFKATKPVPLPPGIPIVIQDIPFNLMPHPSAELSSGTVVVSQNFAANPSAENNLTDWWAGVVGTDLPQPVIERTNELVSDGDWSVKATATAAAAGTTETLFIGQSIVRRFLDFPSQRVSFNLWASGSVQSGTAVLGLIEFSAQWYGGGNQNLRTDVLGSLDASGGAVSAKSLLPPPGAEGVHVTARLNLVSWNAGAVIRLYADALAVTVP
jgi:hypothetical protein